MIECNLEKEAAAVVTQSGSYLNFWILGYLIQKDKQQLIMIIILFPQTR